MIKFGVIEKLKRKTGVSMILVIFEVTLFMVLMILVIDGGSLLYNKAAMQNISDVAAISGANAGKDAFYSVVDGKTAMVKQNLADPVAREIIEANKGVLLNGQVNSISLNPSGKKINGRGLSTRNQYYGGSFTVELKAVFNTNFLKNVFWTNGAKIPKIELKSASRVQVRPED